MLTSLRIKNFKAWKDTGQIRLAPLTVIFGANSSGKSSLGHLLLMLKQTSLSTDRRRALHLGDANTLIDLGNFSDCLHGHDKTNKLEFEISWKLPMSLEVKDPQAGRSAPTKLHGDELSLTVVIEEKSEKGKAGQPEVASIEYKLFHAKNNALTVAFRREQSGRFILDTDNYKLVRNTGRQWPLDEPEKFYRISEQSLARFQNARFLTDFALATENMLSKFYYLGPLREYPRRTYQWAGDTPEDVGHKGEYTIPAILAAESDKRKLNRGPKKRAMTFSPFIADWLKTLGVIDGFRVKQVADERKEFEVLIKTHPQASEVKISDVGFGVSQVLPVLVESFYCPFHSVVWMEQPEIHLHPKVQCELADVFISAIHAREDSKDRGIQLIVESHSEHFLNRLQRRVAEGQLNPEEVAIYFCKRSGSGTTLDPLKLNLYGDIENWPENFFGNELEELSARTIAATQRKRMEQTVN